MRETIVVIHLIFLHSCIVRLLYATTARSIVAGSSQSDLRTVIHIERSLHQTLSERPSADNNSPIPILNSPRKDFRCRSRTLIYHYHKSALLEQSLLLSFQLLTRRLCSLGIDNQLVATEKLVANINSHIEVSATIAPQIENKALHSLRLQFCYCLYHFFI